MRPIETTAVASGLRLALRSGRPSGRVHIALGGADRRRALPHLFDDTFAAVITLFEYELGTLVLLETRRPTSSQLSEDIYDLVNRAADIVGVEPRYCGQVGRGPWS